MYISKIFEILCFGVFTPLSPFHLKSLFRTLFGMTFQTQFPREQSISLKANACVGDKVGDVLLTWPLAPFLLLTLPSGESLSQSLDFLFLLCNLENEKVFNVGGLVDKWIKNDLIQTMTQLDFLT